MKNSRFTKRLRPVAKNCQFCANKTEPDYKDPLSLQKYMTERGKILGMARSGVCSKHQRALKIQIKRARHIAFLPYIVRA